MSTAMLEAPVETTDAVMPEVATRDDSRQRALIPPQALARIRAVVIGVGAVGRQVAIQLAAIGVSQITIYDHDTVGPENLAPQGFLEGDLGKPKVEAVKDMVGLMNSACVILPRPNRFRISDVAGWDPGEDELAHIDTVVFCCVDSMEARALIWNAVKDQPFVKAFFDSRSASEMIRVFGVAKPNDDTYYTTTLFSDAEAHVGDCSTRMTIYMSYVASGMMLCQFAHWLRKMPLVPDQSFNMLGGELTTPEE